MSVTLTSIQEVLHDEAFDGEYKGSEAFDVDNHTFREICLNTEGIRSWNGNHDPLCFSPMDLERMAKHNPRWAVPLLALAKDGGAVLS